MVKNMNRSRVAIIPCSSYEEETVYKAVKAGIDILGGIEGFIGLKDNILIKPNLLSPAVPEKAVTTHPAVTAAIFRLLSEQGYKSLSYGDSPGHGSTEAAAEKSGHSTYAIKYGIKNADMQHEKLTVFTDGLTAKSFHFTKAVTEADSIISVCKMKTHALEKITGAVKNVYGYICGARKASGHVSYPNAGVFARMLCDIHRYKSPKLTVMDAITAMEGNGPGSGDPIDMNLIIISSDPVAIDSIFCNLVYLDPELVPTCVQSEVMGIGHYKEENIEPILCELINGEYSCHRIDFKELKERFGNSKFNVDRTGDKKTLLSRYSDIMTELARKPYIEKEKCIHCGICVEHCPVPGKAINFTTENRNAPPSYDYSKCIRCYCCQEMCPQHAIKVKGRS